jgi:hypothetical protein
MKKLMQTLDAEVDRRVEQLIERLRPQLHHLVRTEVVNALAYTVKVDAGPITPKQAQKIVTDVNATAAITSIRGIVETPNGWACVHCGTTFKTQRAASIHARACKPEEKQKPQGSRRGPRRGPRRCIKPGCNAQSKGPRFHHLCAKHINAPKKQWQAWQKQARKQPRKKTRAAATTGRIEG